MAQRPLTDEPRRLSRHSDIVFRDTVVGRTAYVAGTGLAVWQIVSILRAFHGDIAAMAESYEIPEGLLAAAITYAAEYPDEIQVAIDDDDSYDVERLQALHPNIELFEVRPDAEDSREPKQS